MISTKPSPTTAPIPNTSKEEHREQAPAVLAQAMKNLGVRWPLDYRLHSKAFNDGNVTAHHGIIPQEADAPVSAMEPDEAKVYTAICERYAMQFLPPAVVRREREHGKRGRRNA